MFLKKKKLILYKAKFSQFLVTKKMRNMGKKALSNVIVDRLSHGLDYSNK